MTSHPLYPYIGGMGYEPEPLIYCFTYMEIEYLREGSKDAVYYTAYTQNSLDRFGSRFVLYRVWSRMWYVRSLIIKLIGTAINYNLKHFYPSGFV